MATDDASTTSRCVSMSACKTSCAATMQSCVSKPRSPSTRLRIMAAGARLTTLTTALPCTASRKATASGGGG
eukprot:4001482-Lingulodinium_polyedra.AAC.1